MFVCSHAWYRWFELAAAGGNSEGLYNVGALYAYGSAGYERNVTRGVEYFERSANHTRPFPMAVHALGNYHYGMFDPVRNLKS